VDFLAVERNNAIHAHAHFILGKLALRLKKFAASSATAMLARDPLMAPTARQRHLILGLVGERIEEQKVHYV
jgi:hypothetical protein